MAYTDTKTPIVYYGGKTAILNHILPMLPLHEVYTEVFFGGGTVFFAKEKAKHETINDRLELVVNFYRVLKLNFRALKRLIDSSLLSRDLHHYGLSIIRAHRNKERVNKIELAWAFWLCTNFAYSNKIGGGYKYSNHATGSGTHTMQKRKKNFTEHLVERIENCYIENNDAIVILESRNVPKAFHYLDPPYPNADQGHYAGYKWDQYANLITWCAHDCKGKFLLSSYNSDMLEEFIQANGWYKKQITHRIQAPRKSGGAKIEVLVSNYRTGHLTMDLFKQ